MSKKPCRFCESVDIKIKAVDNEISSTACQSGIDVQSSTWSGWGNRNE